MWNNVDVYVDIGDSDIDIDHVFGLELFRWLDYVIKFSIIYCHVSECDAGVWIVNWIYSLLICKTLNYK
jgi:hypothetical protein